MRRIYAIANVPPEIGAYGMAKYSRSRMSLQDSLLDLSTAKTQEFLNTFYFNYGHASIADLAHIAIAVEEISLLAAMEIVDEPLWDGQERSTRYQDFSHASYYRPVDAPDTYDPLIGGLFAQYQELYAKSMEALSLRYPCPSTMEAGQWQRTIRARAFDMARHWLPLATHTSLGQITSARALETQLRRLLSSANLELREIASEMKQAVTERPPFNYLLELSRHREIPCPPQWQKLLDPEAPLVPTLAKFIKPNAYRLAVRERATALAQSLLPNAGIDLGPPVRLHYVNNLLAHHLTVLLYAHCGHSYASVHQIVDNLSAARQQALLDEVFAARGTHDEWLSLFRSGPLVFDCRIDVGAFRDLNRHRRVVKTVQPLALEMGFESPPLFEELKVGQTFRQKMGEHYQTLATMSEDCQLYLLPLAHRRRFLLSLDLAEAAYIIELRSQSAGHFSYRQFAQEMYTQLAQSEPAFARHIRVTPPEAFDLYAR